MEARTTFRGARISTGVVIALVVALLVAILLGAVGGYVLRSLSSSSSTTTIAGTLTSSPAPANTSEPYRYPRAK